MTVSYSGLSDTCAIAGTIRPVISLFPIPSWVPDARVRSKLPNPL